MTRDEARDQLRRLLSSVRIRAAREFDGTADIGDAINLLELDVVWQLAHDKLVALVEVAGWHPLTPLEHIFMEVGDV